MTNAEKYIAEYAGISLFEVNEMSYFDYHVLLRDAVIYNLSGHKEGREYLKKSWTMEQTKPDRSKLREKMGDEGGLSYGG